MSSTTRIYDYDYICELIDDKIRKAREKDPAKYEELYDKAIISLIDYGYYDPWNMKIGKGNCDEILQGLVDRGIPASTLKCRYHYGIFHRILEFNYRAGKRNLSVDISEDNKQVTE